MPDLALIDPPPRGELLRQLRPRLAELLPTARVVAEGMLGEDSPIDFVCVDADGGAVLVLVDAGEDGFGLLGRALAQRAWAERRLADWLQLAPELGLRPERGVRLLLLTSRLASGLEAAARQLGDSAPRLVVYRCVRNGAGVEALLERAGLPLPAQPAASPAPAPETPLPAFRTGLSDADLGLSDEELREFE